MFPSFPQVVEEGEDIHFYCIIPQNVTCWLFQNDTLLPANAYTNLEQDVLLIENVKVENSGTYTCVGKVDGFLTSDSVFFENDVVLIVEG